jgi:hypothetical protein
VIATKAKPDRTAEKRGQEERDQRHLPAQKRPHHRDHLDVAEAKRFLAQHAAHQLAHAEQQQAAGDGPDERVSKPRRQHEAERQADDDPRQRDDVGQDAVLEVDHEQDDHRAGEDEACRQQPRGTEQPRGPGKEDRRDEFDDRVLNRDRGLAPAAASPQHEPAEDGQILPGANLTVAMRAEGPSPQHGPP